MKSWQVMLLVVGLAAVGFAVYWFGFRKKPSITPPVAAQPPVQNQTTSQKIEGFAKGAAKKVLSSALDTFF